MGPRSHLQHGREPARLVHLAPARLGRADPGGRLHEVRRGDPHAGARRAGGGGVRAATAPTPGTSGRSRSSCPTGLDLPVVRRHGVRARDEHPRRLVRLGLEPRGGAAVPARADVAGGHVPRRQRSASRLVPELAARRPRHARPAAVPRGRSRTASSSTRTAGRCRSRSATSIEPQDVIKESGAEILRLWVAMSDYTRGDPRRQGDPRARRRGVPQDAQHAAVSWSRTCTTSTRRPIACRSSALRGGRSLHRSRGTREVARDGRSRAYEAYDYRDDLPGAERVRHRRPERVLRRRLEGSAVHVRRAVARAALGADGDVHHGRRPDAAARADPAGHRRRAVAAPAGHARGVGAPGAVPARRRARRAGATPTLLDALGAAARRCASRCSREIEPQRKDKQIGSSLQAQGRAVGARRRAARCSSATRDELPMLFIVSEVELRPAPTDVEAHAEARPRVTIERAGGVKCERCWRYVPTVSSEPAVGRAVRALPGRAAPSRMTMAVEPLRRRGRMRAGAAPRSSSGCRSSIVVARSADQGAGPARRCRCTTA